MAAYDLKRRYGLTSDQMQQLLKRQKGRCAICRKRLDEGKTNVDHDHTTGVVRGVLCRHCNLGLGHFFDDPALLMVAASYLLP